MSELFMNKDQWAEIYDIARYQGYAVHNVIVMMCAANQNITEPELVEAVKKWSRERTSWEERNN